MHEIDAVVTAEDLRLLADVGFSAISRGDDRSAEAIFAGLTAARPDGEAGPIGTALVHLHRGDADAAAREEFQAWDFGLKQIGRISFKSLRTNQVYIVKSLSDVLKGNYFGDW